MVRRQAHQPQDHVLASVEAVFSGLGPSSVSSVAGSVHTEPIRAEDAENRRYDVARGHEHLPSEEECA